MIFTPLRFSSQMLVNLVPDEGEERTAAAGGAVRMGQGVAPFGGRGRTAGDAAAARAGGAGGGGGGAARYFTGSGNRLGGN
jgi:hypothetical protein